MTIAATRARTPEGVVFVRTIPPHCWDMRDGPRNPSLFAIGSVSGVRIVKIEIVTLVVMGLVASAAHPLVDGRHEAAHTESHDEGTVLAVHVVPFEDGGYDVLERARVLNLNLSQIG